jgi:hypothetical protein
MSDFALIVPENFIQATRDSGYKSLGSALAELVDNAFEANATKVIITIGKIAEGATSDVRVSVADDGMGMDRDTLRHALQFGWSSRFNHRNSHGRYGMGLPNASLSHARRVDVFSSANGRTAAATYLDVDAVAGGNANYIPQPRPVDWKEFANRIPWRRGTVITWRNCDRLVDRKLGPLTRRLRAELGRLFRYQLWARKTIQVNGELVTPVDPLFLVQSAGLFGASRYGNDLKFPVEVSGGRTSIISAQFVELPVAEWHSLSNEEKNAHGIAKNAGVSIVRAGREIDSGWFFMGQKRKENYDDWWRCEVRFEPDLDELFGVTHTKQEIHPTEQLLAILVPDLEKNARELNARARRAFIEVKAETHRRTSETIAERYDSLIEPPPIAASSAVGDNGRKRRGSRGRVAGLQYRIRFRRLDDDNLFVSELDGSRLTVALNEAHPFVRAAWPKDSDRIGEGGETQRNLELLLLAAVRSELALCAEGRDRERLSVFRRKWSNTLATFLT